MPHPGILSAFLTVANTKPSLGVGTRGSSSFLQPKPLCDSDLKPKSNTPEEEGLEAPAHLGYSASEAAPSGIPGLLLMLDPEFALQGFRLLSRAELAAPALLLAATPKETFKAQPRGVLKIPGNLGVTMFM